MKKYFTLILFSIIIICFISCDHKHRQPTEYISSEWQIIKRFDREVSISELFVIEPDGWATGTLIDLSDPMNPKSQSIWLRTHDNWKTYTEQFPGAANLHNIFFVTNKIGWAISGERTLVRTEDGGNSWQQVNLDNVEQLISFYFQNDLEGWTRGYPTFKTTDGGETWVAKYYDNHLVINSNIHYVTENIAFTTGSSELALSSGLYKTTNGGESWELIYHPTHEYINSFDTVDGINIWYVSGNVLLYSDDGGTTFSIQDYNIDGTVIKFFDAQDGIIVGKNGLWRTSNGGFTWIKQSAEIPSEAQGGARFQIVSSRDIWGWGQNAIFRCQ